MKVNSDKLKEKLTAYQVTSQMPGRESRQNLSKIEEKWGA